jgi:uncharacterized protein involved in exopolysaccharide biosynthesis
MSGPLHRPASGRAERAPADGIETPGRVAATDVIDFAEIAGALRRGRRLIAGASLLGLAAAVGVLAFAPKRFAGGATVLLRSANEGGGSLLSRLGVPAELAPASLGSAMKSPMETELQLLGSDAVLGRVSDSLGLQVRVLSPEGVPPWRLLQPRGYPGSWKKVRLSFTRTGTAAYQVTGRDVSGTIAPGRPLQTPYGALTLAPGELPQAFELQLLDREDALERLRARVDVAKAGGEVARVGYAAPDSLSAMEVPNAVVAMYLQRRRTTDRGTNQHRVEFLEAQVDSVGAQLVGAELALRRYQESSGVVDPELVGKVDLEAASQVREQLAANQVESSALEQLLRQVGAGTMGARQLAAYPSFLRSPAINEMLGQLATLETELSALKVRFTDVEPEVAAMQRRVNELEQQLQPMGAAYAQSLARQRSVLEAQAGRFDASLGALPAQAQSFTRLAREVRRLGQTALALQTQLLDARLAAIGEGGEVRQVDAAMVPKKPAFPRPSLVLPAGLLGGLLLGGLTALATGFLSPRLNAAGEAGRLLGVPAARLGEGSPLFFALLSRHDHAVVVPLDDEALARETVQWLGARAPQDGARRVAPLERSFATLGSESRGAAPGGLGDGYAAADGAHGWARGYSALPPLATSPDVPSRLAPGTPVVLAVRRGTPRGAVEEAATALQVAGAELIACVMR